MPPATLLVIGCGSRGTTYAEFALRCPDRARVVAVAEPRDFHRNDLADRCAVPPEMRFRTWQEAAARPKLADAVLICTLDEEHEAPAVAFANLGYAILLEKPMAPTEQACRNIVAAVKANHTIFAVCHVLRYTSQTRKIKELIQRLRENPETKEVIIATNQTAEGEATAMYLGRLIKPSGIKVTRIASGLPMGSDLEYADDVTLSKAMQARHEF